VYARAWRAFHNRDLAASDKLGFPNHILPAEPALDFRESIAPMTKNTSPPRR
jgi:hypothetical protein